MYVHTKALWVVFVYSHVGGVLWEIGVAGKLHNLNLPFFLTGEFGPIRFNWDIRVVYPAFVP